MARKKLTKRGIEALKPPAKGQLDIYDTDGPPGFHVRVSQSGVKSFALLYRRGGRKRKWTIGRFPALSLADARAKAAKVDVLKEDPQKAKVELRRAGTFTELADQFFAAMDSRLKPTTLVEWKRIWKAELKPELGGMLPDEITRADIRALLDEKAKTAPIMANHVLGLVRRIYSWAVETDRLQASPCIGLKKPAPAKSRDRVLSHDEIKTVLDSVEKTKRKGKDGKLIDSSYGRPFSRAFFRLSLFTAARKSELLNAKWADIDLGESLWMIPDTKMGRAHVLPLSTAAAETLKPLPRNSEWVFRNDAGRIVNHPKRAIRDLRTDTGLDFTIHDLRRTTATGLAQIGIRTEVISAVLNHVVSGPEATRVYQRHSWIPEMRTALERWAQALERIQTAEPAKVARMS